MPQVDDKIFTRIETQIHKGIDAQRTLLEIQMFQPDPLLSAMKVYRISWHRRWRMRIWRYLVTLWWAICGVDLARPYEWD